MALSFEKQGYMYWFWNALFEIFAAVSMSNKNHSPFVQTFVSSGRYKPY